MQSAGLAGAAELARGSRASRGSRMGRARAQGVGFAGLVHLRSRLDCRVAGAKEHVRRDGLEQTRVLAKQNKGRC